MTSTVLGSYLVAALPMTKVGALVLDLRVHVHFSREEKPPVAALTMVLFIFAVVPPSGTDP
jgi:hypothetical protein